MHIFYKGKPRPYWLGFFVAGGKNMVFILPATTGTQGVAAANPPAVEARAARAPVATGTPFSGWRVVAQQYRVIGDTRREMEIVQH